MLGYLIIVNEVNKTTTRVNSVEDLSEAIKGTVIEKAINEGARKAAEGFMRDYKKMKEGVKDGQ